MHRGVWLGLLVGGLLPLVGAQGIADIATSPYDLAKFVETHHDFDWAPLWRALHISDEWVFMQPCEQGFPGVPPCSSELITIVDPHLLILILKDGSTDLQAFLRYQPVGAGRWQFSGAYAPNVKYFGPGHRVTRFGAKPFLVVTEQGNAGSGLSSEIESWIDLTDKVFEPVLRFTSEGHLVAAPAPIGRRVSGSIVSLATKPVERAGVSFHVEFTTLGPDFKEILIGERRDEVVYARTSTRRFELDQNVSTATPHEVGVFYDDLDSTFTNEEFLTFNLKGLLAIARSTDQTRRSWVAKFLQRCTDTAESRQLKALLASEP